MAEIGQRPIKHRDRRIKLIKISGDMCVDCKQKFHYSVYEFHHRDPKEKKFKLGGKELNRRWKSVMEEAVKCDLLCPSCHKIRHVKMKEEGRTFDEQKENGKSNSK